MRALVTSILASRNKIVIDVHDCVGGVIMPARSKSTSRHALLAMYPKVSSLTEWRNVPGRPTLLEIRVLQGFSPTHITNPDPKGFSRCEKTLKVSQREAFFKKDGVFMYNLDCQVAIKWTEERNVHMLL
jgi:hypothetical protein